MGSAASQLSRSSKPIFNHTYSHGGWATLALVVMMAVLLGCRLTAGPPPRISPSAPPAPTALPQPTSSPSPARPAGSPAPSQTPVLPPSPTPIVTPASNLPDFLALIRPENFARLQRLARFPSDPTEPLAAAGISPDGKSVAAITCYQKVLLWDLASGKVTTGSQSTSGGTPVPAERCEPAQELSFSPGWSILASSTSLDYRDQHWEAVQIWRAPGEGSLLASQVLTVTAKSITTLAFSPDGRLLAAGTSESEVKLWFVPAILELPKLRPGEPARLPPLATLKLADRVLSLAFSPDGNLMAAASALPEGGTLKPVVQLWDISKLYTEGEDSLTPVRTIQAQSGPLWEVAFSTQGDWIAAVGSGLAMWETSTGSPADRVDGPFDSLAISPAGDILAAAGEERLSLWEVLSQPIHASGVPRWLQDQFTISPLEGRITSLSFSPDERFLIILYEQGIVDVWGVTP